MRSPTITGRVLSSIISVSIPETTERRSVDGLATAVLPATISREQPDMLRRGAAASADQVDPSVVDEALDLGRATISGVSL